MRTKIIAICSLLALLLASGQVAAQSMESVEPFKLVTYSVDGTQSMGLYE